MPFYKTDNEVNRPKSSAYPKELKHVGHHIRRKRIELGLFQKDVGKAIGVTEDCITLWENGHSKPQIRLYPKITAFLGYSPFEAGNNDLGGLIRRYRQAHGLSQKSLGKMLKVDASTIGAWEKGEQKPQPKAYKPLLLLIPNLVKL